MGRGRRLLATVGAMVAAATLTGAAALAVPAIAAAADGDDATESTAAGRPVGPPDRFDGREDLAEALADELDLPVDRVTEALEAAEETLREQREKAAREHLTERLDAAVEAGTLTREQADAVLDAYDADVLGGAGPLVTHHRLPDRPRLGAGERHRRAAPERDDAGFTDPDASASASGAAWRRAAVAAA